MPPNSTSMSRRAFLRSALGLAAGTLAASLPLAGCRRPDYPATPYTPLLFSDKELAVLDGAARRMLPAGPGRLGAGEVEVARAVDTLMAGANPRLQADLKKLLNALEDQTWLALHFQPFTAMPPGVQDAYLRAWLDSRLGMMRQGVLALNKLSASIFYMDPRTWPQIGYPGPWIGRYDFGLGLDNQGDLAKSPNPNVFARFPA